MKKQFTLRILGLLVDLTVMTSLSLVACSPAATPTPTRAATPTPTLEPSVTIAAPSPVASASVDLSQVLGRWDAQRVAVEDSSVDDIAKGYLEDGKNSSSPIPYVLAGQMLMVGGDMRAAVEALNKARAIDPRADAPHFVLADVYYRLAFFDMIDRGLCSVKLTPVQEIPEASLHHGHLQIEIWELVNPGRPAVYEELLASQGIDELTLIKISLYILGLVQEMLPVSSGEIDELLDDLGGPPEMLPVPECEPDEGSKHLLRMAYEEITLAEQGTPLETPGVMIVYKDRIDNLSVRLQVLLGSEVVPIVQPSLVPTSEPEPLTSDSWEDVIKRISAHIDAQSKKKTDELHQGDYEALQKEQQDVCVSDNLMQCYTVGYMFLQLARLGYYDAYADAIHTFNLILNKDPEFGRAHYGLGRAYYDLCLTDLTLRGQMQTTESGLFIPVLDDQSADLFQRALDELEIALALDLELADNSDIRNFIEMIKAKLISYWIQQGYEMETTGNPTGAVEYYEKVLRLDPQSYVANFNRGNALFALSKFQEAIHAYDEALTVKPNSADAIHNREIARIREAGFQWPNGTQAIAFLMRDLQSSDHKSQLGAALLLTLECMGENQEACDILDVAAQQYPTLPDDLKKLEMPKR